MPRPAPDSDTDLPDRTVRFKMGTLGTIITAILSAGGALGAGAWMLRGDVVMREQLDKAIADVAAQDAAALKAHAAVIETALRPLVENLRDTASLLGDLREEVAELRGEIRGRSGSSSSSR